MPQTKKSAIRKRSGSHHRRSKQYSAVYWPYIPVLLLTAAVFLFSAVRAPIQSAVLAYATTMDSEGLLVATNNERAKHGRSALAINSSLTAAAQSKANDMAARDYWSHETPDGQQPWVFVDTAGYNYIKAGENLAYGFLNPDQTISGWMNSSSHRANMLDSSFVEVGFGYTNAENYRSSGQQTIVVAMYGQPVGQSQPTIAQNTPGDDETLALAGSQAQPEEALTASSITESGAEYTTAHSSQPVTRIASITGDSSMWGIFGLGIVSGSAAAGMLVSHGVRLRRLIRRGERFVLHHPLLDVSLVSILLLSAFLSQYVGFIQ